MTLRILLLVSAIVPFLVGCRETGPRFDPRPPSPSLTSLPYETAGVTNLDMSAFTAVTPLGPHSTEALLPPTNFFRLGPGDTLDVELIGEPGVPVSVVVGPDGKIYYHLLPGTFVWGLSISEAKKVLEDSLAKYMRVRPEVALTLRGVGSKQIWMLGSVQRPGVYSLATPMTILEALALAGGTLSAAGSSTEVADLKKSFVMRDGQILNVDFQQLLRQGDLSQNIYLQPNDFVYLRPGISHDIYVLGYVTAPNIIPFREPTTLVSAIASCGGPRQYSYQSHVAIIRGSLSNPMIATVDYKAIVKGEAPDVRLEQGDIVYVPQSPYRLLDQFARQVISQFVRTVAVNEGQRAVLPTATPVRVATPIGF